MDIDVPYIDHLSGLSTLREIAARLDRLLPHSIAQTPWALYPYKPEVSFVIAHTQQSILLKYFVGEQAIRVCFNNDNEPVHYDSCVELFISFDGDVNYYNLEFNCTGTCMAAYGASREERQLLPQASINRIRRMSVIESVAEEGCKVVTWQLTLEIPAGVFAHHRISNLADHQCRVNFYKCGDALPEPHFLAWQNIETVEPDFHQPAYFGSMQFV